MDLHGYEITAGDTVYDVVDGVGSVLVVDGPPTDRGILVRFGSGGERWYSSDGTTKLRTLPTLFWQDPIIMVPPPKDSAGWRMAQVMARAALESVEPRGGA